jgi:hypothetical protein
MARNDAELIAAALSATRARKDVAFKREFLDQAPGAWLELLRDLAAMANSGGGVIVLGLEVDGTPSRWDPSGFLRTDVAEIGNRFTQHVGEHFDGFDIREATKAGRRIAVVVVRARTEAPLVFEKPGTYEDATGRERTAFGKGTIYFRHGARSEPGTARDVARFVSREVQRQHRAWRRNIRKVAAAPTGSEVLVARPTARASTSLSDVRVVDDPDAPVVGRADFDATHPHRQTEVVARVNRRIGTTVVSGYDIQCVRRAHATDANAEFFHRPRFGSPQYSDAFIEWLVDEYQQDATFFEKAKERGRAGRSPGTAGGAKS